MTSYKLGKTLKSTKKIFMTHRHALDGKKTPSRFSLQMKFLQYFMSKIKHFHPDFFAQFYKGFQKVWKELSR